MKYWILNVLDSIIPRDVAKKTGKPFGKHLYTSLGYGGVKGEDKGTALLKLCNYTEDEIFFPFQSPSDPTKMIDDPELR